MSERHAVLIGRATEMLEMERAYGANRDDGFARPVTVLGATGIGKTRLVRDFLVRARQAGEAPRVYRGTARDGGPAYEVFARALRARFGLIDGMDADAAKAEVRLHLAAVGDTFGENITLNALGMVARDTHDEQQALRRVSEAYDVARDLGDRNRTATVPANLAAAHDRAGDAVKAGAALKQAEELRDELGAKWALAEAMGALANAYSTRNEQVRAIELTQRSVSILESVQSTVELGVALRLLGELLGADRTTTVSAVPESLAAAARRKTAEHMKRFASIFEALGNQLELARTCHSYARLLARAPEYESDSSMAAEAKLLAERTDEIFVRSRRVAIGNEQATSVR
ncbi:MAG: ATP-binding protein [Myxococcota bacterium]|nr:ATP-binding protein [Myxococcota bacterium]